MTSKRNLQAKDRDDERDVFANSPFNFPRIDAPFVNLNKYLDH